MNNIAAYTWLIAVLCLVTAIADDSLTTKCSGEFQKVTQCLPFATAKAAAPNKDCCDSVTALKTTDPACLCWIIQQIHDGSSEAVGVQEARLLQLPAACNLANASVAECPKLLHMPANSPDAAIFNNVTAAAAPLSGGGGGTTASGGSSTPYTADGVLCKAGVRFSVLVVLTASFSLF